METEAIFATEALVGLLDQSILVTSDDEDGKFNREVVQNPT